MDPRELDLNEIDALLGEDDLALGAEFEEDSDDFDDLLGGDHLGIDDEDFGLDDLDDEEDSLEEILGAIDNQYLSEKEQVFLQNKSFLDSKNPTQLDAFFLDFHETLYGALEEYHNDDEDFSGAHYGAMGADEELDDLELEVDLMSGSCFGSEEEEDAFIEEAILNGHCMGYDEDEFGLLPIAPLAAGFAAAHQGLLGKKAKRSARSTGKKAQNFFQKHGRSIAEGAGALALAPLTGGGSIVALAAGKTMDNAKTKRNYIRKIKSLQRCIKRFANKAKRVNPTVATKLVAGKRAFLRRPFTVMAASTQPNLKILSAAIEGRKINLKNRRLFQLAKGCDKRYMKLRQIWRGLRAKGRTAGLQPPQSIFNALMRTWTRRAKSSAKKSGGVIKAVAATPLMLTAGAVATAPKMLASKKKMMAASNRLRAIRRANAIARRKDQIEMRNKAIAAARKNQALRIQKRKAIMQKLAQEKSADTKMVAANPYMDAADMAALNRARAARVPKPIKPMRPLIKPVRSLGKPKVSAIKAIMNKVEAKIKKIENSIKIHSKHHRTSLKKQQQFAKGSTPYNSQYAKTRKYAQIISNLNNQLKAEKSRLAKMLPSS